jgi:hypothetical protein
MKNVVFWDVTACGTRKTRRFGRTIVSIITGLRSVLRLLVAGNVPSSTNRVTLMKNEKRCSSETSVLTTATRRNVPEDGILDKIQFHHRILRGKEIGVLCLEQETHVNCVQQGIRYGDFGSRRIKQNKAAF